MASKEAERLALVERMQQMAEDKLSMLFSLWDKMGIEDCADRMYVVESHIGQIFDQAVEEEGSNLDNLLVSIEKYGKERTNLLKELGSKHSSQMHDSDSLTLIQMNHQLRSEVARLVVVKDERLGELNSLKRTEQELCNKLKIAPAKLMPFKIVPQESHMTQLKDHISALQATLKYRTEDFGKLKANLMELHRRLGSEPCSTFERNVVCGDEHTFVLSEDNLNSIKDITEKLHYQLMENKETKADLQSKVGVLSQKLNIPVDHYLLEDSENCTDGLLNTLRQQLAALEEVKKQHLAKFLEDAEKDLEQWWNKCYCGEAERIRFKDKASQVLEPRLGEYEAEIERLKQFYNEHRMLLTKVEEWRNLWQDRLELENTQKDPRRLGNFRALREEEKRRNRVNKRLPKIEAEIHVALNTYEATRGTPFLVDGVPFMELCERQTVTHDHKIRREKENKLALKKQLTLQESRYGTTPKTPIRGVVKGKDVKRLQHDPRKDKMCTTRNMSQRHALKEKNDTIITGSNMMMNTLDSVDSNVFREINQDKIANSTFKVESKNSRGKETVSTPQRFPNRPGQDSRYGNTPSRMAHTPSRFGHTPSRLGHTPSRFGISRSGMTPKTNKNRTLTLRSGRELPFLI